MQHVSRIRNDACHHFLHGLLRHAFFQCRAAIRGELVQLKHSNYLPVFYLPALAAAAAAATRAARRSLSALTLFFAAGFAISLSRCERNSGSIWSFLAWAMCSPNLAQRK